MSSLQVSDYGAFFAAVWGHDPFPWQRRLVDDVLAEGWPAVIDLPTASGKTACIDIAIFLLALEAEQAPVARSVGRRIVFAVNRRIIVDEAQARARALAMKLREADPDTVLGAVAARLRRLSDDEEAPPLDVAVLRGGIPRDNRWSRSIGQPTVITSTIDQLGSRLLFRGYGVSRAARPLHAALVANDSLLLLDEAHISQPFMQTLDAIARYRAEPWPEQPVRAPFAFVKMTATPGPTAGRTFHLDAQDKRHPVLRERHGRSKLVSLRKATRAKGKGERGRAEFVKVLVEEARDLVAPDCRNIAVVVNRVATARAVFRRLEELDVSGKLAARGIHLAIGRMRPLDRDRLTNELRDALGPDGSVTAEDPPLFVVATQCLEVGADLDFDGMVSECASLDALRQRFGRLNRRGRDIDARGVLVIRADQVAGHDDPIYGDALSETWQWLEGLATAGGVEVDFGVEAMNRRLEDVEMDGLLAPKANAPVLLPAYLDMWAQTNPGPAPDPDVSLFIHGTERGEPDVQVCWRHDLPAEGEASWLQIVGMCPPTAIECMPVPIGVVRRWLAGNTIADHLRSDLYDSVTAGDDHEPGHRDRRVVVWRGIADSDVVGADDGLRPGDTIVIPEIYGGWDEFGHVPAGAAIDLAETAHHMATGRTLMRLRTQDLDSWGGEEAVEDLRQWLVDPQVELRTAELRVLLLAMADAAPEGETARAASLRRLAMRGFGLEYERYPDGRGVVLRTRRAEAPRDILPALDDGDDLPSSVARSEPVLLADHAQHLHEVIDSIVPLLAVDEHHEALQAAAQLHDWGKADERFQSMLANAPWAPAELVAKSGTMSRTLAERRKARRLSGLPEGFRHEMISVQLAEKATEQLPGDEASRDLALHLVAAHHGWARPFAPVVLDEDPPPIDMRPFGVDSELTSEERRMRTPYRLDSGIAERFWLLTRRFGWWGLPYLEAVLRLCDQLASRREEMAGSIDTADDIAEV